MPTSVGDIALTRNVPDFFQDEGDAALRHRVEWLVHELGVREGFFARHLRVDELVFRRWRIASEPLPPGREGSLKDLWRTVLHLLSFLNFDQQRVRILLQHQVPKNSSGATAGLAPPWSGFLLIDYLEERGPCALPEVDRWVTSLRFGDPYAKASAT